MAGGDNGSELQQLGESAVEAIDAWEATVTQLKHETYEDEDAWPALLDGQLRYLLDVIDGSGAPVTAGARERLTDLRAEWQERQDELRQINRRYIDAINERAALQGMPHVAPID